MGNKTRNIIRIITAIILSVMVVSTVIVVTDWRVRSLDDRLKNQMLDQLIDFSEAVEVSDLLKLNQLDQEEDSPAYKQLFDQVEAYQAHFGLVNVFSMMPSAGSFVHVFNSGYTGGQSLGNTDTTFAGIAQHVFEQAKPMMFGPRLIENVMVMTACMPIIDPLSGEVKMLLGMNFPADDYTQSVRKVHRSALVISMLVIGLILFGFATVYWRNKQSMQLRKKWWHLETVVVVLLGLILTWISASYVWEYLQFERQKAFADQSHEQASLVRHEFATHWENMLFMAKYFANSEYVDEQEVESLTNELLKRSSLSGYLWLENFDLKSVIGILSNTGTDYYNINGMTFKVRLSAVLQDWPEMDSSQFKKMDLSKDLLHRALTDKLPQSKTIDNAGLNNNISNRIAIYLPVFSPSYKIISSGLVNEELKGFLVFVMNPQQSIDIALNRVRWAGDMASVGLVDMMEDSNQDIMASFPAQHATIQHNEHYMEHLEHFAFQQLHPVFVWGRTYGIISHSSRVFENDLYIWFRIVIVIFSGLVITLLSAILLVKSKRIRIKLEALVAKQTRELEERVKELSALASINQALQSATQVEELLAMIPEMIVRGFQDEKNTIVTVEYDGHYYFSSYHPIVDRDTHIAYLKPFGVMKGRIVAKTSHSGGVLKEEGALLDQACQLISRWLEKHEAQLAMAESEDKFHRLIDSAFDAIYLMEGRGYSYVNQSFVKLTGYTKEELLSERFDFDMLLTDKSRQEVEQRYQDRKSGEEVVPQYNLQLKTSSGELRDVEVSTVSIPGKTGMLILGIMHDMTERIKAEMALKNSEEELMLQNEELEVMNEELTESNNHIRKMNLELIQAKEKAEAGDRLKTAFLNNISHEVRTPLNGILGGASLMADPDLPADSRQEILNLIDSSTQRLLRTITQYVDISMLNSATMPVVYQDVSLKEATGTLVQEIQQLCANKNLAFNIRWDEAVEKQLTRTDPVLLGKVLGHLLDNAVKFTLTGKVELCFSGKNPYLEIMIKDTGIGIDPMFKDQIFNSFVQEDQSNIRRFDGNGLGLSICYKICQLLGGSLGFESEKGKGTTFTIQLPYHPSDKISVSDQINLETSQVPGNPVILIAEDEESNYAVLELMLQRRLSADVLRAHNGQQAVEYCQMNDTIHLVIMDIKMPLMDGFEATRLIKSIRPQLPVIGLTAYGLSGDKRRVLEAGCDAYLSKPFKTKELLGLIDNLLKKEKP